MTGSFDALIKEPLKTSRIIAYFDFDGTLTDRDTLLPFLIFCIGWLRFLWLLPRLIPIVLCYLCKITDNQETKQKTLKLVFKGWNHQKLEKAAHNFASSCLNKYLQPEIYAKLEWHRECGHQIAIVSANLAIYLRYFVKLHRIDHLIATEIEVVDEIVTGRLATKNCYGSQKTSRIAEYLQVAGLSFDYSYGYGNSRGDYEMLCYVNEPYYVLSGQLEEFKADNAKD